MLHVPRNEELFLIQKILEFHKDDYVVFRITQTMLNKSIIDANRSIYKLLKNLNIFNNFRLLFTIITDGKIESKSTIAINENGYIAKDITPFFNL